MDYPDTPKNCPDCGPRKNHAAPTPNLGGVGIIWAVLLPLIAILLVAWFIPHQLLPATLSPLIPHLPGIRQQTPMAVAIIGAVIILHLLGLIDDRKRLGPWGKLLVQLLVATTLAVFFDFRIFQFLGTRFGQPGHIACIVLSILWITTIINAMNFMDNMDGLSAGVAAIIAAGYFTIAIIGEQWFVAALTALLLGSLLGFLVFNWPPARLFMGDGGSLVLGLLLAVISIRTTYFRPAHTPGFSPGFPPEHSPGYSPTHWYNLLMPLIVLAVPLYDMAAVICIRLRRRCNPFTADRRHLSHRLLNRGYSVRLTLLIIYLATAATTLLGVLLAT